MQAGRALLGKYMWLQSLKTVLAWLSPLQAASLIPWPVTLKFLFHVKVGAISDTCSFMFVY